MRQFWELLYRDRFSRIGFASGLVFFLGNILLDIWPQQHPHYVLRNWLLFSFVYWTAWLTGMSIGAAIRLSMRRRTN